MSLRTQHDLAKLRGERARVESSIGGAKGARLVAVLRSGFARWTAAPTDAGAPRGARLPYEQAAFERDRRWRLTAAMLPYWLGLQGNSRGTIKRSEVVRVLGEAAGVYKGTFSGPVLEMMKYGREHEIWGIVGYMEMTRHLVGLGSTRVRETRANGEVMETYVDKRGDGSEVTREWEWHEALSATPDGFVIDALASGFGRGLGGKGLLEVKCPANNDPRHDIDGVPRRHVADIRIKPEQNTYLMLQAFQQLHTCTEAEHIDLVHWKRNSIMNARTGVLEQNDYVWIARLYAHQGHMDKIRALIKGSVQDFVRAVRAVRGVDDLSDTEMEDEGDEYLRYVDQSNAWAQKLVSQGEDTLALSQRRLIRAALKAWASESMCWRNGGEPVSEKGPYPWRSYKYLADRGMSTLGLCHRFHVSSSEASNHDGAATKVVGAQSQTVLGYDPVVLPRLSGVPYQNRAIQAGDLWGNEPIGMY